jgi:isopentenyl-diphosphate Delta-isomerase
MKTVMGDQVILVDEQDRELGLADKMSVHRGHGQLHRAVSVLIYRKNNGTVEVLLQKRAGTKPLWPGYWTNTICTHPRKNESPADCAVRRLKEEMGISIHNADLTKTDDFYYHSSYTSDLAEHEYDHVFLCRYDGPVTPAPAEVSGWRWVSWFDVIVEVTQHPERFTGWFRLMVEREKLLAEIKQL